MFNSCTKAVSIFCGSFQETALISGISDIIVVRWKDGSYHSTPFLICFGSRTLLHKGKKANLFINQILISTLPFTVDKFGYLHPMKPSSQMLQKLGLRSGKNQIRFQLQSQVISSEIYLFSEEDKILVSDFDGTMTKSDVRGLYHNLKSKDYLHEGYSNLVESIQKNGYKIVWLTMRSLALYDISKNYAKKFTNVSGVLLTEPQEFFPAVKKQIMKKTGNIKTNMMLVIKQLFPLQVNPFVGGLGNRENDAIAYLAAGIPKNRIFIIDKQSQVHKLDQNKPMTYQEIEKQVNLYFPSIRKQKLKVSLKQGLSYSLTSSLNLSRVKSLDKFRTY